MRLVVILCVPFLSPLIYWRENFVTWFEFSTEELISGIWKNSQIISGRNMSHLMKKDGGT